MIRHHRKMTRNAMRYQSPREYKLRQRTSTVSLQMYRRTRVAWPPDSFISDIIPCDVVPCGECPRVSLVETTMTHVAVYLESQHDSFALECILDEVTDFLFFFVTLSGSPLLRDGSVVSKDQHITSPIRTLQSDQQSRSV